MLYCLVHENVLHEDGLPYRLDLKTLGHYTTMAKALAAQQRFAELPGFRDYPDGFDIRVVMPCDQSWEDAEGCGVVYRIGYSNPNNVWDKLEFWIGPYYVDEDLAELMRDVTQDEDRFRSAEDALWYYEITLDGDDALWSKGFVTEGDEDRPLSEAQDAEDGSI